MDETLGHRKIQINNEVFFAEILSDIRSGKTVKINVIGNSMLPFLRYGDQVLLEAVDLDNIQPGDIVLARYKKQYILHRIRRIKGDTVFLIGDNNLKLIEEVSKSELLAKVLQGFRGQKQLHLYSRKSIVKSTLYYYLRPLRRVVSKIIR